MKITLKKGNSCHELSVSDEITIKSLKDLISEQIKIFENFQILFLKSGCLVIKTQTELEENHNLNEYGLKEGSVIYLGQSSQSTEDSSFLFPKDPKDSILFFGQKLLSYCQSSSFEKFLKLKQDLSKLQSSNQMNFSLELVLNHTKEDLWSSIHFVCKSGHSGLLQELLTLGADYLSETSDSWTPLMLASFNGFVMCVEILLQQPLIKIDQVTSRGSALHVACQAGRSKVVKLLLDFGANPSLENREGKIPLEYSSKTSILELIPKYVGKNLLMKYSKNEPDRALEWSGELYWMTSWQLNDKLVFLMLDVESKSLFQYQKKNYFQEKQQPELVIPLKSIKKVQKAEGNQIEKKFFIQILTDSETFQYYSKTPEIALIWMQKISEAVKISKLSSTCSSFTSPSLALASFDELDFEENDEDSTEDPVSFSSFEIFEEVGQGSFGKVFKVVKKTSGFRYAMKVVNKLELKRNNQYKYVVAECRIQKVISHPFIIKLFWAFQTPNNIYMIFEFCPFGDLAKLLRTSSKFPEPVARFYISEVVLALEYLHSIDMIFRDLKLENILIDELGHAKLGDFGLAKENISQSEPSSTFCGSPGYLPPEVIKNEKVWKPADVYSLGICLFEMLSGGLPFNDRSIFRLFKQITTGKISFPGHFSSAAKSLIRSLTHKTPEKRLKITEVKNHPFFEKVDWNALMNKQWACPLDFKQFACESREKSLFEDRDYSKVEDRVIASVLI